MPTQASHLPRYLTRFMGREREIAKLNRKYNVGSPGLPLP